MFPQCKCLTLALWAGGRVLCLNGVHTLGNELENPKMAMIARPDHSQRPLVVACDFELEASPSKVYEAWTEKFGLWFADEETLQTVPEIGRPFFFYTPSAWGRHPHYGRFLELKENEVVEMCWLTGDGTQEGTQGAETVLRIELTPKGDGTSIRLTHSGHVSEKSRSGHAENWPLALQELDKKLTGTN